MAADSSIKILWNTGIASLYASASGLLLKLSRPQSGEEVLLDARAAAELAFFFFTFLAGEAMVVYSQLLANGVVPAVSPALAKKLSCIPIAAFLLAIASEVPLLGGLGSTAVFVELVGIGRVGGAREDEAARGFVEDDLGAGVARDDVHDVNA